MTDVRDGCGLDLDAITAPDAVAAVRSYPRRYRALLSGWTDDEDPEDVVRRRPPGGGWSALEHVARVRDVLGAVDGAVRRIVVVDDPVIDGPGVVALGRPVGTAEDAAPPPEADRIDPLLDALATAAEDLGRALADVPPDGWDRTGVVGGERRSVLWLAREAVHQGSHHLRDAERVLRQVRGAAGSTTDG